MLTGKAAVITGAGRGIGREIAILMASHGAKVVVNDLGAGLDGEGQDQSPAQQTVADIQARGGEAVVNTDSVAEVDGAERIITAALDHFSALDIVVNNAGILRDRIFHRMSQQDWQQVLAVHLQGAFNVSRAAAGHFRNQQHGSFIHFTSTSGLIGNLGQANYAAAKMGIVGLSKSIALDMQRYKVRSNCIAPFAWSRMIGSIPTASEDQTRRVEKLKQMTPAKIAPLVTYLASDKAQHVSGQIFAVRNNEIFLISQPRPLRSVHRSEGWIPETIAEHAMPALEKSFYSLDVSADVFSWDPI